MHPWATSRPLMTSCANKKSPPRLPSRRGFLAPNRAKMEAASDMALIDKFRAFARKTVGLLNKLYLRAKIYELQ